MTGHAVSGLTVDGIEKSFGATQVLRGVDLSVKAGSTTAIVGASGCGKTTLLRIIAGFETPDAGSVALDGRSLAQGRAAVPAHKRGIGYVAQDGALFPHLSVRENIMFGLPWRSRRSRSRIQELLAMVSLEPDHADRRPEELSGGQQQRVALARALALEPKLMLLDEPFSALDAGLRSAMRKSVQATLSAAGVTTVLVTHDQEEALSFADQVAVMRAGVLTQVGPPQELYSHPVDRFTAEFLGDVVLLTATVTDVGLADCALGVVPVPSSTPLGTTQIMLRPEQIVATAEVSASPAADAVVLEREFLGHDSLLRLRFSEGQAGEFGAGEFCVRQMSVIAPEVGASVSLKVLGEAVVLA